MSCLKINNYLVVSIDFFFKFLCYICDKSDKVFLRDYDL